MNYHHPLGPEFARWAEMTDKYRSRLEKATPDDIPNRSQLARMANLLRALARTVTGSDAAA